jgi:hypothetical protein
LRERKKKKEYTEQPNLLSRQIDTFGSNFFFFSCSSQCKRDVAIPILGQNLGFWRSFEITSIFLKILGLDIFWIIDGGERDLGIQEILPKKIESH